VWWVVDGVRLDDKNRMVARAGKLGLPAVTITAWRNLRGFSSWRGMPLTVLWARTMTAHRGLPFDAEEWLTARGKRVLGWLPQALVADHGVAP
jgi:hypothetical protein